jgi:hypothetical protein
MFAEIVNFGPTIKLVPNSSIQFVEYAFNLDTLGRLARRFIERAPDRAAQGGDAKIYELIPAWVDPDAPASDVEPTAKPTDREYTISERAALEVFLQKWVPVPMLRVKAGADGSEDLDHGPTNWARVRVSEVLDRRPDEPITHRAVFAFDTEVLERRKNRPYTAPSHEDAANQHEFRFAYRFRDIAWFLGAPLPDGELNPLAGFQDWVPAWLNEMFREFKQAQRPERPLRDTDFPNALESYARYLVFLELLARAVKPRTIRLIDTISENPVVKPVSVDLVLDVGNSRTCGILIESHPNEDRVDVNNSLVLALRDLSEPDRIYAEPFESHVELSEAQFGRPHLSVRSSRGRAFFWPSPVRVGPEAARFRQTALGTEASTGMSSPKRYLCDTRAVNQEWRFPDRDYANNSTPLIDRAIRQFVNLKGDVIQQLEVDRKRYGFRVANDDRIGATRLTFSRSSFFTFMMAEIVCHALSMINNPGVRESRRTKDAPRKLRRIIMTVPPAMAVQEQRLMRSRAEGAIKLVWQLMGWWDNPPAGLIVPDVHVAWDEASCVQFVYLYGEITQKLGGSISGFLRLIGRERPFAEADSRPAAGSKPEPSVRIASIDIGGGTTDLMITTYYMEGRAIKPVQNFREGFRTAGDDILKGVIERAVLPAIEARLSEAGHADPRGFLIDRFGGDRANMAEQEKHLRRQFVVRILEPIALRMLSDAEAATPASEPLGASRSFSDFFLSTANGGALQLPPKRFLDFLEEPAKRQGAARFALADCVFATDLDVIEQVVTSVLDVVIDHLCEAIYEFDCDLVMLSGRPSRLPSLVDLVVNKLAVSPDRVLPLHQYQAGNWYPFRSRDNRRISDPKTTTAVGGMLCALAESQVTNFTMFTSRLGLRSTAKFIGEIETDGRLHEDKVYFKNVDLDAKRQSNDQRHTFKYYAPIRLGYRQLPIERWIASPLYRLRLRAGLDTAQIKAPIAVTIERASEGVVDEDAPEALIQSESMKEDFRIADAYDSNGVDVSRKMELVLNTLDDEHGYWLDTGILSIG